ncbi:MAG: hypothetical protein JJU34_18395 [Lunatimonas sp.]|uniref:hypothetical protein n=1 Tax=Lunatimonas sp. TaxID=2060141 RepID=UPI00263B95DD|nr:hypothetical protein [Lunatimonas sp.]MCC5939256.1 hypothetical protein [Lunatimonas sp.]
MSNRNHAKRSLIFSIIFMAIGFSSFSQTSSVIIPSNSSTGSLEKNLLFYAQTRYTVSQQGAATVSLPMMFDGRFLASGTTVGVNESNPTIILIEDLPNTHTQQAAWLGWSSRAWNPSKFKIEVFDTHNGANQWFEVANVFGHTAKHYMVSVSARNISKIRYTFYLATGTNGRMQLSELFFIHPEAVHAYDGLLLQQNANGNVGIGVPNPSHRLEVNGTVRAKEVRLEANNWPDYVFRDEYRLMPLDELRGFISRYGHLPGVPSEAEVVEHGVQVGYLNTVLLKKIEELTLYTISQEKRLEQQEKTIDVLVKRLERLENK